MSSSRTAPRWARLGTAWVAGWAIACAFTRPNPDHCANNSGDDYCAALDPDAPFCARDGCGLYDPGENGTGCVVRPIVAPECHAACGAKPREGQACGAGADATTGDASGTQGPTEDGSSGEPLCTTSAECDAAVPICVDGQCQACGTAPDGDAACADRDPSRPVCDSQACVQCTALIACDEAQPVCDSSGTCVGCSYHEQCPQSACRVAMGECFPTDTVRWVDGTARVNGNGSSAAPFDNLGDGLALGGGQLRVVVVKHLPQGVRYADATVEVGGATELAIVGDPATVGLVGVGQPDGANSPVVKVFEGGALYLHKISLRGDHFGAEVSDALLSADNSEIANNPAGGLVANNGAELLLRNVMVFHNGTAEGLTGGIVMTASRLDAVGLTLAMSLSSATPVNLGCDELVVGSIRNSIIGSPSLNSIDADCAGIDIEGSAIDTGQHWPANFIVTDFQSGWFADVGGGDGHLKPGVTEPFEDLGTWLLGDPSTDIDGDPRPMVSGRPDWAGADVP